MIAIYIDSVHWRLGMSCGPVNYAYMTVLYIDSVYGGWACHGPHDHGIAHRIDHVSDLDWERKLERDLSRALIAYVRNGKGV